MFSKLCVFFSPHLDDAALSCATLIQRLTGVATQVIIVSVFSHPSSLPYSTESTSVVRNAGFRNAQEYFVARRKEDSRALRGLGATSVHWGFVDALWRKRSYFRFNKTGAGSLLCRNIYPTMSSLFGGVSLSDNDLAESVKDTVKQFLDTLAKQHIKPTFFLPLGVGGHVDHVIVRDAVRSLIQGVVYWEDYPYGVHATSSNLLNLTLFNNKRMLMLLRPKLQWKQKILRYYQSQYYALFPTGKIPNHVEKYWISNEFL